MRAKAVRVLHALRDDVAGVTMIEYGIATALMSVAIIAFLADVDDPSGLLGRIKLLMDSVLS